jgi:DUF4097 and DUF4098 domain-containing protein YvlB
MISTAVLAASLTAFALAPGADTTIAVSRGASLNVKNYSGEVFIEGWNRNAIRIRTDDESDEKVLVVPSSGAFTVRASAKHEEDQSADLRLIVPVWMNVAISGIHTDVIVTGTQGQVKVETVHGDVIVRGGRQRIDLNTVDDDICVSDASGVVRAETVNGDAYIWRTASDSVDVSTVNGDVVYEGTMGEHGGYRFTSHNGDISVAMPRAASAAVAVSTFSGDFQSNFPVTLTGNHSSNRFQFCLGSCSARVELQSFQGTIQLYRATAIPSSRIQKIDGIVDRILEKRIDQRLDAKTQQKIEQKIERAARIVEKFNERYKKRHDDKDGSGDEDEDGDGE